MTKKFFKVFFERKFWAFAGSSLIVSVAYMDPGNWGTNISAGANFKYDLLWMVWLASLMAMVFQYLSGKLGIAGYSLAELVKDKLKNKYLIFIYWVLSEIMILATDLAEFLGIVIALKLLFGIPLIWGPYLAVLEVLGFLIMTHKKFRNLEKFFVLFVSVIGLTFVYEVFLAKPDVAEVLLHSFKPVLNPSNIMVAIGIIGATVMPHALFVHSWLIKNKVDNFIGPQDKLLSYHFGENLLSLTIAGCINAAMLIMAAAVFFGLAGQTATLEGAYITLKPIFGNFAAIVFAVALLSAGLASSITGALAGQAVMEGLVDFRISPLFRQLITRVINILPLTIAIILDIEPLKVLIYSQVALSLLLPLPIIPLLIFTADKKIMKELVNSKFTTILAYSFGIIILGFNFYLIYHYLI